MFAELVGLDGEGVGYLNLMAVANGAYDEIQEDIKAGRKSYAPVNRKLTPEEIEDLNRLFQAFCEVTLDEYVDRC